MIDKALSDVILCQHFQVRLTGNLAEMGAKGVASLHLHASAWVEAHGLIEEAIRHALKGRVVRAARVIVNQGKVILDHEQRLSPMPRSAKHFLTIPGLRPLDR